MRRVLADTNIIVDLLAHREEFYSDAAQLFSLADKKEIEIFISSLSFANTSYLLNKFKSGKEAREILRKFKLLVHIVPLNEKIIDLALSDDQFPDFEDGLQYYSALEKQVGLIITRNKKDFRNAKIPILNAHEYLASL